MDEPADYCREIEAYLCQKNGGHLVRIVGPAFERVREWAAQGVPLKVAFRGIDRCCERATARGGRRRPMHIEFCEADVLDAFDGWRRALGVSATQVAETPESAGEWGSRSRKGSLASHIARAVSRLLAPRSTGAEHAYDEVIARTTLELDELAVSAKTARGDARARIIARLAELDRTIVTAATEHTDQRMTASLLAEADAELGGLAERMPPDFLVHARQVAFERLLRDALNLPELLYE